VIHFFISNRRRRACAAGSWIKADYFRTSRSKRGCQQTIRRGRSGSWSAMFEALSSLLNAFSSREPVSSSLEDALAGVQPLARTTAREDRGYMYALGWT
jgi:hypothetical protein